MSKEKVKNQRKYIIMIVVLVTIIGIAIASYVIICNANHANRNTKALKDQKIQNINSKVNEDKTIDGILFSNIEFTQEGNTVTFQADIKNTTDQKVPSFGVRLKFFNNDVLDLGEPYPLVIVAQTTELEPGASSIIVATSKSFENVIQSDDLVIERIHDEWEASEE